MPTPSRRRPAFPGALLAVLVGCGDGRGPSSDAGADGGGTDATQPPYDAGGVDAMTMHPPVDAAGDRTVDAGAVVDAPTMADGIAEGCAPLTCPQAQEAGRVSGCAPVDLGCGERQECATSCAPGQVCHGSVCCSPATCAELQDGAAAGCQPVALGCGLQSSCHPCAPGRVCQGGSCVPCSRPLALTAAHYAVGSQPASVRVADVDGDGHVDLTVVNAATNDVSVLLGNPDGTFQSAKSFPSGGTAPRSLAVADFDGDGNLDAAVANWNDHLELLRGGGDGTFAAAVRVPTNEPPGPLVVADVDGDGKPDLIVAYHSRVGYCYGCTGSVLLGNGDGTFQPPAAFRLRPAGSGPHAAQYYPPLLAVADLNGDGRPDVVDEQGPSVENRGLVGPPSVFVLLGNGDGTLASPLEYRGGYDPTALAIADFNGDGTPDLGLANREYYFTAPGRVTTWIGVGDGTFGNAVDHPAEKDSAAAVAVDLDGDGNVDFVLSQSGHVSVLRGDGRGGFKGHIDISGLALASSLAAADFDGDGRPDLVATDPVGNDVTVLLVSGCAP